MRELQLKFITNTITERWMRILNVIEQQNMFTIVGLSQQLGVSKRTILKDVSELKITLKRVRFLSQIPLAIF
ncbi:HTH domain-containing protein [Enterococcus mundtii]|nr:HTH domain-containing protein [Enterococcus mundtii]